MVFREETPTQNLLRFIVSQKMDLEDYPKLEGLLSERFEISDAKGNPAVKAIVEKVIYWEKAHWMYDSLEVILNRDFKIALRKAAV